MTTWIAASEAEAEAEAEAGADIRPVTRDAVRPERVALLSRETSVPETKTQSGLWIWTGLVVRPVSCGLWASVVSGCGILSVGSWLERPFCVHHSNNSNVINSRWIFGMKRCV